MKVGRKLGFAAQISRKHARFVMPYVAKKNMDKICAKISKSPRKSAPTANENVRITPNRGSLAGP